MAYTISTCSSVLAIEDVTLVHAASRSNILCSTFTEAFPITQTTIQAVVSDTAKMDITCTALVTRETFAKEVLILTIMAASMGTWVLVTGLWTARTLTWWFCWW